MGLRNLPSSASNAHLFTISLLKLTSHLWFHPLTYDHFTAFIQRSLLLNEIQNPHRNSDILLFLNQVLQIMENPKILGLKVILQMRKLRFMH